MLLRTVTACTPAVRAADVLRSARHARCMATALQFERFGAPEVVIKRTEVSTPSVGENQVLVQMLAAPVSPADISQIESRIAAGSLPAVGGNEGVGLVKAVGGSVRGIKKDDWVVPTRVGLGTWRTDLVVSSEDVAKVPNDLPVEQAAVIGSTCVALRLLDDFVELQKGDVIIHNGANSSVGKALVRIAALRGLKTISVLRDRHDYAENADYLKNKGSFLVCNEHFLLSQEYREVMADVSTPVLGLNCVNGRIGVDTARALGEGATFVTYGSAPRQPGLQLPTSLLLQRDLRVRGFSMARWLERASASARGKLVEQAVELVRDHDVKVLCMRFPFDEFPSALAMAREPFHPRKPLLMFGDYYKHPRFESERELTKEEWKKHREEQLEDVNYAP